MAGDRARRMRALARALEARCGVVRAEASYNGRGWEITWSNGPVSLRGPVGAEAARLGLDPAAIGLHRLVQDDAMPVQAVRLGRAGQLPLARGAAATAAAIELAAESTDYPDRPADAAEAALAARLAAETAAQPGVRWVDAGTVAALICRCGGVGWLFVPAAGAVPAGLGEALAVLTAAYATGQASRDWAERGTLLDPATALAVVRADPAPAAPAACAGLTVLRARQDDLERAELGLLGAARTGGATWAQLATAIGATTRQAAYKRHRDLTGRHHPSP